MAEKLSREEKVARAKELVANIATHISDVEMGAPMPGEAAIDIKELHALVDSLWKDDRGRAP